MNISGITNRTFEFKAETANKCLEWFDEIFKHIKNSDGFKKQLSANGVQKPWRFDNMSEKQFLKEADTGDILLFRGTAAGGLLTRTFTASHFDHVAMVLKFETDQNEVYLVESVGNLGVSLNRWEYLREHVGEGKFYQKLALRHVNFDRGNKMVDNLETFLSEAIGLKYGISANKLTK